MQYFVIVYSRAQGKILLGPETFADSERKAALQRRFQLEACWRDDPDIEVVVLGSESEAQIRRTHGRYFHTVAELARAAGSAAALGAP